MHSALEVAVKRYSWPGFEAVSAGFDSRHKKWSPDQVLKSSSSSSWRWSKPQTMWYCHMNDGGAGLLWPDLLSVPQTTNCVHSHPGHHEHLWTLCCMPLTTDWFPHQRYRWFSRSSPVARSHRVTGLFQGKDWGWFLKCYDLWFGNLGCPSPVILLIYLPSEKTWCCMGQVWKVFCATFEEKLVPIDLLSWKAELWRNSTKTFLSRSFLSTTHQD